jgi:hypothetical protein
MSAANLATSNSAKKANQRNRMHRYRAKLYAQGICGRCAELPRREGLKTCGACIDRLRTPEWLQYQRELRAARHARGVCYLCMKRAPVPGKKACDECTKSGTQTYRELRNRRKAAGICPRCGENPPDKGFVCCTSCRARIFTLLP